MNKVGHSMKSVIALSRSYNDNMPAQLNAIGHLGQALGCATLDLRTADYRTADRQALATLSWWPVIVLSGRPTKIAGLWAHLQDWPWPKACFVETMIAGGSEVQLGATARLRSDDLPIVALGVHGPAVELDALTRKLSLWRPSHGD